jgi:HAD superfamily hydrolase (TIGR01450 family)
MNGTIRAVVFDLDGVLRVGDKAIEGVNEVFNFLQSHNIPFMIATNECRWTPHVLFGMLLAMGIEVPSVDCIYSAGMAVRDYLHSKHARHSPSKQLSVGIVGESGLQDVLKAEDWITIVEKPLDSFSSYLVVGTVNKINKTHIEKLQTWIQHRCKIITTCCDTSDPSTLKGEVTATTTLAMPDMLIQMACGKPIDVYSTGKPNSIFARAIMSHFPSLQPDHILLVGDTLYTDIRLAEEAGFQSALVLSGNSQRETLEDYVISPDYVIDSVRDLPSLLKWGVALEMANNV